MSPAINAPKKVPAERIEVKRDWVDEGMAASLVWSLMKYGMALMSDGFPRGHETRRMTTHRTPPIHPVS